MLESALQGGKGQGVAPMERAAADLSNATADAIAESATKPKVEVQSQAALPMMSTEAMSFAPGGVEIAASGPRQQG